MNATLSKAWARVGFDDAQRVEAVLVRGTLAGVLGGALALLIAGVGNPLPAAAYGLAFGTGIMVLVLPRLGWPAVLAFTGAVAMLPVFIRWTPSTLPYFFTLPLGLALALEARAPLRRVAVLVGPSLGAAWCLAVVRWLSARHLGPLGESLGVLGVLLGGLFVAGGAALAWLTFSYDALEVRLAGQPKLHHAWSRLRTALARLPRGPAQARLQRLVREGAERCLGAKAERDAAQRGLDEQAEREAREAVAALTERLAQTTDGELTAHLEQLLRVHRDTLEQLDGMRRKLERLEARELAEAAWLDTAAFSLELAPKAEQALLDVGARLEGLARARG